MTVEKIIFSSNSDKQKCTKHYLHHHTKMAYHCVLLFILFIVYGQNIDKINTLRCAKSCWFGPVELGNKHPFNTPCNIIEIDPTTTECTAAIAIRLSENILLGVLDTKARVSNMSATLETILDFNKHSTVSMINYTCTTRDNCDQEFVLESVGSSKWSLLNETKTRAKITSLLIDETFSEKNFTCAHNITCQVPYDNCQADYIQESLSPHSNTTKFNNNFKCIINHMTEIAVFHYFNRPSENYTTVTNVMCNKDKCNERETVERAFNIIQNEFTLPLNYSQFIPKN